MEIPRRVFRERRRLFVRFLLGFGSKVVGFACKSKQKRGRNQGFFALFWFTFSKNKPKQGEKWTESFFFSRPEEEIFVKMSVFRDLDNGFLYAFPDWQIQSAFCLFDTGGLRIGVVAENDPLLFLNSLFQQSAFFFV